MKILVADKYPDKGIASLKSLGCDIVYDPEAKGPALIKLIKDSEAEILVVRSSQVTAEAMVGSKLKLIVRAGAGYNTIDVKKATELSIYVSNCPGKNSIAVAELAFGLMLALDRRIPENVAALKAGKWNKKEFGKARGLFERTLGLVGFGFIGHEMAMRARAFGMQVLAYDPPLPRKEIISAGALCCDSLEELVSLSDIVSIHVALVPGTRNLINEKVLSHMKPGAFLINTSRAEVVDYDALAKAMKEKKIRAGLDVYPNEPAQAAAEFQTPFSSLEGFCGTHHIGASTDQAQEAIADETTRILKVYLETGRVANQVNRF
ncbi:MAG: phosphoglycerate dehydrogenase [Candidatus Riflebacteria bacterium]|nr:phosphoglycerate dehydrogenase [Candidatus Riflebacteria bacterium]